VGPRAGLDTEDTGKILCPCRGLQIQAKKLIFHVNCFKQLANYGVRLHRLKLQEVQYGRVANARGACHRTMVVPAVHSLSS
jgi:hypothetical protein